MSAKTALITGVSGQDGSYLAELLLEKGYEVHGILRRASVFTSARIDAIQSDPSINDKRFFTYWGDVTDSSNLNRILERTGPDEIYNLAAQSHVGVSFDVPEYTADVDALGALRLLDAYKSQQLGARFYQASTSELFGNSPSIPQTEETPMQPRSPYAVAKLYAYWLVNNYREAYGLYACNGILFNHESPRRDPRFVTRKITTGIAMMKQGLQSELKLGNLDAKRDWGYAPEYVEAMWLMLQQDRPDDYVIASGETHSVREFCECAFEVAGTAIEWHGEGVEEKGVDKATGATLIAVDPRFFRPTEVDLLLGDCSKARESLPWQPRTTFQQLVEIMVRADLERDWRQ